ncbi:EMG1/NEP1 methyltransferase [Novymonas esmeraldas]|uniref:EMG1/NEP1 methyltransferase n=1 Tax=Novymonas esmeraldas TaxID=1808958 RepID=A0AAW0EW51_9TRYP
MQSSFKRQHSGGSSGGFDGRGGRGRGRGAGRDGGRGFSRTEGRGGRGGRGRGSRGGGDGGDGGRDRDRSAAGMSSSSKWSGGYRPQVADESIPRPHLPGERTRGGRGGAAEFASRPLPSSSSAYPRSFASRGGRPVPGASPRPASSSSGSRSTAAKPRDVVVILEKAGILLGNMGLVDAYDRAATTEIANESLKDVRPDIVHQCLLALFDSDLAYQHRLRVYISLFVRQGKVIEVSPALRPPRTYARFRGLMSALLRDGRICSTEGQVLMRLLPGSVAPIIPHGAEVVGLTNSLASPVVTATQLARQAVAAPVDDALQGGIKHVTAFYCIACTDDCSLDGIDYISKSVCLSAYPMTAHVQCARVCEGHTRVEPASGHGSSSAAAAGTRGQRAADASGSSNGNGGVGVDASGASRRAGEIFPVDQTENADE